MNATITNGPRLTAVLRADGRHGWVGYRIGRSKPFPGEGIALSIDASPPKSYLHVMQTLGLDDEGIHLVVRRSTYGLYLESDLGKTIFHYDYDREPEDKYPLAHLQITGTSSPLRELVSRRAIETQLGRLHFPVGGKRFRPSLEDVVEFLIIEGLVDAKSGWKDVVDQHRSDFHRIQLMAATRRDPDAASEVLGGLGYRVEPPPPS